MRVGVIIAAVFAGLLALVAFVPRFIDWTAQRQWIEAGLAAALDEPVRINGAVDAVLLPSPALIAQNISIGGPDRGVEADIGSLEARLRLGPLFGGRLEVERLVLRDATLETRDTPRSEQDTPPEADSPRAGDPRLALDDVELTNLTWRVDGETLVFPTASLSARSFSGPFSAGGVITWEGADVSFDLGLEALRPDRPAGATVSLAWPDGATAAFSGSADHDQSPWQFAGRLTGQAPSPLSWFSALELSYPAAFNDDLESRLDARAVGNFSALVVEDVRLALGRSRLSGRVAFDWTGPEMTGDAALTFGQLDLDQLLSSAVAPQSPENSDSPAPTTPETLQSSEPTGWSIQLSATADLISWRGGVLSNARLRGLANVGGVDVEAASAQLPGATTVTGQGRVPWSRSGAWDLEWQGSTANARALATWVGLGPALEALPAGRFSQAAVTSKLEGQGSELRIDISDALIDQTTVAGTIFPNTEDRGVIFDLSLPSLTLDMMMPAPSAPASLQAVEASPDLPESPLFDRWQGQFNIGSVLFQGRQAQNVSVSLRNSEGEVRVDRLRIEDVEGISISASHVPLSPRSWSELTAGQLTLQATNMSRVFRLLDRPEPAWVPEGSFSLALAGAPQENGIAFSLEAAAGDSSLSGEVLLNGAALSAETWQADLTGVIDTTPLGTAFAGLGLGPKTEFSMTVDGVGSRADVRRAALQGPGGQLQGTGWVDQAPDGLVFEADITLATQRAEGDDSADVTEPAAPQLPKPRFSNAPLDLGWLNSLQGRVTARLDEAVLFGLPPTTGAFVAEFDRTALSVPALDLAFGSGRLTGTGRLTADAPGFEVDLEAETLPLGPDRAVSLSFAGGTDGRSARDWARALTGQGRYAAVADPSVDTPQISLASLMAPFDGLAAIGRFLARPQGRSTLETDFQVTGGVIGFEDMRFVAPSYQGTFDGRFDLYAWDLDAAGRVDLIGSTISRLLGQQVTLPGVLPIEIAGDPAEPRIKVDISGGLLPD